MSAQGGAKPQRGKSQPWDPSPPLAKAPNGAALTKDAESRTVPLGLNFRRDIATQGYVSRLRLCAPPWAGIAPSFWDLRARLRALPRKPMASANLVGL